MALHMIINMEDERSNRRQQNLKSGHVWWLLFTSSITRIVEPKKLFFIKIIYDHDFDHDYLF